MVENNNPDEVKQESSDASQPCCSSTSDGGDCCTLGGGKNWKTIIFVVVILLAGAVAAHSLVTKSDEKASISPQAASSFDTAEPSIEAGATTEQSSKATAVSCGVTLDSIKSLGKMAADKKANVAFIFLASEKEDSARTASAQVEATMNMLSSKGKQVAAFTLHKGADGYDQLTKQFKVNSLPCVIVAGKGCGAAAVSGDITEPKLLEAFVIASRPVSGCSPSGCGPSGCSPSGSK
jgi:hypothetical protein